MDYPYKPVPTDLPLIEPIRTRWSPVAFDDRPVEEEKIAALFEAARWAPSCFNEQPWRYIYAAKADHAARDILESALTPGNTWAKHAGLLAVSFASASFAHNGKPNRFAMHDLGAASGFLVLQLPSLGLIGHQMAGYDQDKVRAAFKVPEEFLSGSLIAIGYPGDASALEPDVLAKQQKPRTRKDRTDIAFRGMWNEKGLAA